MAISYKNFLDTANKAGLSGQFSMHDLNLAEKYPEFGMNLVTLKNQWNSATTKEAKDAINAAANALRMEYGNYSGGNDGLDYITGGLNPGSLGKNEAISNTLGQMTDFPAFDFTMERPTYQGTYDGLVKDFSDRLRDFGSFSYDAESDPVYSQYKKQYLRESDRASRNTLGQAAAQNGGQVSTAAAAAASQAGDYYKSQLTDKIPELTAQAYDAYRQEYTSLLNGLNAAKGLQNQEYQQYLESLDQWQQQRDNAYGQYLDRYEMLSGTYDALLSQQKFDYEQLLDLLAYREEQKKALQKE